MTVVVLAGGTGGAKLARGMLDVVGEELVVVANTADDVELYGAHVSPDPDLVAFWLADRIDARGWGLAGDTFHAMDRLRARGEEVWFNLGDEVGVGRDVGAVELDVVGGVGHHDELLAHDVEHPAGQLGSARPARQDHDRHARQGRRPRASGTRPDCVDAGRSGQMRRRPTRRRFAGARAGTEPPEPDARVSPAPIHAA